MAVDPRLELDRAGVTVGLTPEVDTRAPRGAGGFGEADRAEADAVSGPVVSASAMGEARAEPTPSISARAPTRPTEMYEDEPGMPLLASTA